MDFITIKANAKINLGLDIIGKRQDGYHNIKTLMHSVDLSDVLHFSKSDEIKISSNFDQLPNDKTNIIYKCINAIREYSDCSGALNCTVQKNIPMQAGLAGGSADGAAVLYAYNKIYDLGYSTETLAKIGAKVGADIPFLLYGGCALCEGIGDVITKYDTSFDTPCTIVMPNMQVNTSLAYEYMDNTEIEIRCDFSSIREKIRNMEFANTNRCINNIFEKYMAHINSESLMAKQQLTELGAFASGLTGSGACFYGLFKTTEESINAAEVLKNKYDFVCATKLCSESLIEIK